MNAIQNRKTKLAEKVKQTTPKPINNPQFVRPSLNYADIIKNNPIQNNCLKTNTYTNQENKLGALFEGIDKLNQLCDIDKLLDIVPRFK